MRIFLVASTFLLALLLGPSRPAFAKLPDNCIERVESKSAELVGKISAEINRQHSRLENHHGAISGAFSEFAMYFKGAWVSECLSTYPEYKDRYNRWLAEHAQPVSNAAALKLSEVCTAYTESLITENQEKIEAMIARGAVSEALTLSRSFEGYLARPIVQGCKSSHARVKEVAEGYIPAIRNQAQLAAATKSFSSRVFNVERVLRNAEEALASKGTQMQEAPGVLEGSQGQADFGRSVRDCVLEASKLRDFGATEEHMLANAQSTKPERLPPGATWTAPDGPAGMSLSEAETMCRDADRGIDELFAKVEAHNQEYQALRAKVWEQGNLKGSGMRKVYSENGKRWPSVENLGSTIVWTYRSYTTGALTHECKEYVFGKSGSLKSRRVRLCN